MTSENVTKSFCSSDFTIFFSSYIITGEKQNDFILWQTPQPRKRQVGEGYNSYLQTQKHCEDGEGSGSLSQNKSEELG